MAAEQRDARGSALAVYLRERAAAFSMSADVTGEQSTARAGMALLDAAMLAERLPFSDDRLRRLSEAGRFESRPDDGEVFVETPALRAAMQRPLAGRAQTGEEILALLVRTAADE